MARRKAPVKSSFSFSSSLFWRGGINLVVLILVGLTLSLVVHFLRQVIEIARLDERRVQLETANAQLEADLVSLRGAVEYAESDVYVERIAREQLGYAREGDIVLVPRFEVVVPDASPTATPIRLFAPEPNWYRWWRALRPEPRHLGNPPAGKHSGEHADGK